MFGAQSLPLFTPVLRPKPRWVQVTLAAVQGCLLFTKALLNPFPSLSHHLVARVYESKAEFRSALQHEKEGYTIYKNQVGARGPLCPALGSPSAPQCRSWEQLRAREPSL